MRVSVDFLKKIRPIKIMNAVNNGPQIGRGDQTRGNEVWYKKARIPYARNHDASFYSGYGGCHSVDINAVFPNFDADPYDENSYDFILTDKYIEDTLSVGTKTFYRLGSRIEHEIKKYGTLVPKDFHKWAVICEHIIKHCNEGFAGGKHYGIEYFEIWNEPDLDPDDSLNKRTWGGTKAQFFDLYEIASKHLKEKFPNVKIGGPALAFDFKWGEEFLYEMKKRNAPLDFFSWHIYSFDTKRIINKEREVKDLLNKYGFDNTESILNEWNYIKDWSDNFVYSVEQINGMKGAAFVSDVLSRSQDEELDMLMYYDARPSTVFNGLFDFYTFKPLKGYYPFLMWADLRELGTEVLSCSENDNVYVVSACDGNKAAIMLTYYTDNDNERTNYPIELDLQGLDIIKKDVFVLDKDNTFTINLSENIIMKPNSCIFIKINY